MTVRPPLVVALALVVPLAAACRDKNGGDDADGGVDASTQTRIYDVQDDAMPAGTPVTLRGVVVTAIDNYGPRKGNFFVAELEGGAYSGVLVFGAPLEQVATLAVGDLVDITGAEKDEFSLAEDDATVTELVPVAGGEMSVVKVGTAPVPAPQVLDALAIGRMETAAREAEYEKWEGVLVRVENVSVTSEIRPVSSSNPDPEFVAFRITGVLEVDSSLAEIPYSTTPPPWLTGGDCLASITGIGDYFFNYKVLPRATADIVMGGTDCPAAEAPGTCTDGIDNDANGFTDCADRGCLTEPTCTTNTTIAMIQMGLTTGMVNLSDVVVTGRDTFSSTSQGIWVADAAVAAPHTGIYVFTGSSAPDPAWTIGSLVNVRGTVVEFDSQLTQIQQATITAAAGGGTPPTPVTGIGAATLADVTSGEPYEGVLVRLANATVANNALGNNKVSLSVGGETIIVDDFAYPYNVATDFPMGASISCITGIMHWNHFDDHRILVPREPADIVPTGGCP
ncbi:MAG: hypothetical protein HS111_27900 [Kofleriaceae bacterium]|nr:hypothetical protein [Kofleriaceae bacterium]MCL4223471.1 hypothetical protein [Myxococcales bacterium]